MKQPQLFRKIGEDKYVPVDKLDPDEDVYYWNDDLQKIVLKKTEK